jgi:hypothetical protein
VSIEAGEAMTLGVARRLPMSDLGSRVDGALARTFRRFCRLVGCGHVSGLLMRLVWPLALMQRMPAPST